jgi:hypothetical protein
MKDRLYSALFQACIALVLLVACIFNLFVRKETHD